MLDWLLLIFFHSVRFFVLLFLCLPTYAWKSFRRKRLRDRRRRRTEEEESQETKREKKQKDKEKSRTEVNIEVSWWIADLKTDQLNAFRVNSKTE